MIKLFATKAEARHHLQTAWCVNCNKPLSQGRFRNQDNEIACRTEIWCSCGEVYEIGVVQGPLIPRKEIDKSIDTNIKKGKIKNLMRVK